ncbi:MAG: GAF domain-containing protein [Thermodesulfobacteriota bacterium]
MLFREGSGKRFVLLLRWILILIVSSILYYSAPPQSLLSLSFFFILIYLSTNIFLSLIPEQWFQKSFFSFCILLIDVVLTSWGLYLAVGNDSQFYMVFFLILLVAAASRQALLLYAALVLILVVYGASLYFRAPGDFLKTETLLRFPFLFIVTFFFHGMIESYNRLFQEKEILKGDYRELEVLTEVARSIELNRNLPKFLLRLTLILTSKFAFTRCTAVFLDQNEESGCMVSSNDKPEAPPLMLDLKKYPALKASLNKESGPEDFEEETPLSKDISRYILKIIPLEFRGKNLGTLYLRANTPHPSFTHREQFFLERLASIAAMAVYNYGEDRPGTF